MYGRFNFGRLIIALINFAPIIVSITSPPVLEDALQLRWLNWCVNSVKLFNLVLTRRVIAIIADIPQFDGAHLYSYQVFVWIRFAKFLWSLADIHYLPEILVHRSLFNNFGPFISSGWTLSVQTFYYLLAVLGSHFLQELSLLPYLNMILFLRERAQSVALLGFVLE